MDRRLALDDSALSVGCTGPGVSFCHVDIFNDNSAVLSFYAQNLTDLTFIFTGNNFDFVVFFYVTFII
jgi:hypothetical protein